MPTSNYKNTQLLLSSADFSNALSNHCTVAWVTWPERPKGMKDEVKQAQRAATQKLGPGGAPRLLVHIIFGFTFENRKLCWKRTHSCSELVGIVQLEGASSHHEEALKRAWAIWRQKRLSSKWRAILELWTWQRCVQEKFTLLPVERTILCHCIICHWLELLPNLLTIL